MSSGLSSSAALEVALIASLGRCFDLPLSKPEIAALAYSIERQELGINCGQMDPYAVALGGLLCLECGSEPPKWQMIDSRTGSMTFIVAGSGVMNDTAAILSELNDLWDAGDERLRRYFDEVAELVRDAWTLLAKDDGRSPEALGECMDRAQLHLGEDLHLSTPLLSMLCETARDSGATGAKVTGVGRGGCVVALAERDSVEGVAATLRSIADWVEVVTVSGHGLRDESEHAFREFVQRQ